MNPEQKILLVQRKKTLNFHSIENIIAVLTAEFSRDSFEVFHLPNESKSVKSRIVNLLRIVPFRKRIIHITGHDHYLLLFPFKRTVLTIHDIEALSRKSGIKRYLFKKLWFDIPLKRATIITTVSIFSKNELKEKLGVKKPITVIRNPLTLKFNFSPKTKWSKRIKILQLGTKENKNVERLFYALQNIECEITLIGKLSIRQVSLLRSLKIKYRNLVNLSKTDLMSEFCQCELLSFVSTYEGFGLPIIEAQAIGRVVLTSNLSSMPEVAGEGAYFINPFSVESIKDGIIRLKNDEELRKALIEKGRLNVKQFEPKIIANQYSKLYKNLESS